MAKIGDDDATSTAAAAAADASPTDAPLLSTEPPPPAAALTRPPPPPRQTRESLTLREKWAVKSFCEQRVGECRARSEAPPSQEVLRAEVLAKFGWALGRSTLSRVLLADWKALAATRNASMKRRRAPLFPAFEAELVRFVTARLAHVDTPGAAAESKGPVRVLTEALILEEAQRLKHVHGIKNEQLVLSVGWLARFKHRNGIRLRKKTGAVEPASLAQDAGAAAHFPPSAAGLLVDDRAYFVVDPSAASASDVAASGFLRPQLHGMDAQTAHVEADAALKRAVLAAAAPPPTLTVVAEDSSNVARLPNVSEMTRSTLCGACEQQPHDRPAALQRATAHIPSAIRALACACERALPVDIEGLNVVVVGSNSVAEAFALAALVGPDGAVTCVDSALANVHAAQQHAASYALALGYPAPNVRFVHGLAPSAGAASDSLRHARSDLVLLNCSFQSVSSASEKASLLAFAHSLLRDGGELRVSAVCCSRRLSSAFCSAQRATGAVGGDDVSMESDAVVVAELLRAVYVADFARVCRRVGFSALRQLPERAVDLAAVGAGSLAVASGDAKFSTAAFRVFKLPPSVDDSAEDYGQYAVFTGGVASGGSGDDATAPPVHRLDRDFCFERGVQVRVDGNTAQLLQRSWLQRVFTVVGDQSTHLGPFEAAAEMV
ncbi:hypothetical protein PybrP1_005905 [[Pythium] brassicae (nom. inval.)]|nr:hypothetical protein PybrP1_005905 [[Pythium] brassicae (nom. inval.)]